MSFIFAIAIMFVYFTRSTTGGTDLASLGIGNYLMAFFQGFSFLFGAFCSGFSGYAGNRSFLTERHVGLRAGQPKVCPI
jgi:hypothetical protein